MLVSGGMGTWRRTWLQSLVLLFLLQIGMVTLRWINPRVGWPQDYMVSKSLIKKNPNLTKERANEWR